MAARETKRNHPPSKIGPQTIESLRTPTSAVRGGGRNNEQQEQTSERTIPYCASAVMISKVTSAALRLRVERELPDMMSASEGERGVMEKQT